MRNRAIGKKLLLRSLALLLGAALLLGGGALAAPPEGTTVWGFSEGMALCELDGKWGYVDGSRSVSIPIQYDSAVSFLWALPP